MIQECYLGNDLGCRDRNKRLHFVVYIYHRGQQCETNIRWDSEPVLGLVAKPQDVIGKLFHRKRQKSLKRF